jgi:hypothetical protein
MKQQGFSVKIKWNNALNMTRKKLLSEDLHILYKANNLFIMHRIMIEENKLTLMAGFLLR